MQKDIDRLGDEIATLAAHLAAATARWLSLIAEFDERSGWVAGGHKSCADWLQWRCGLSPQAAREHVRVALRLRELPLVSESFTPGELSYSKARAITRVAEPETEAELVRLARAASAAQLERIVRGYRSVLAVEEGEQRQWQARELSWWYDEDGALCLRARVPAEQGAVLVRALEACRDELGPPPAEAPAGASAEARERGQSTRARNADALLALAQTTLAERASSADVYQVVVHVDAEFAGAHAHGAGCCADEGGCASAQAQHAGGRCELEDGIPLSKAAAERLLCDASIVHVLEAGGELLALGRKTRTIAAPLRRALRIRDKGCRFPGCAQRYHADGHHVIPWALGGKTELANLVLLCRHHHRLVHSGGFTVRRTGHGFVFRNPAGEQIAQAPRQPRGDCTEITAASARRSVRASAEALLPLDGNPRFNLGWAIEGIFDARRPRRE